MCMNAFIWKLFVYLLATYLFLHLKALFDGQSSNSNEERNHRRLQRQFYKLKRIYKNLRRAIKSTQKSRKLCRKTIVKFAIKFLLFLYFYFYLKASLLFEHTSKIYYAFNSTEIRNIKCNTKNIMDYGVNTYTFLERNCYSFITAYNVGYTTRKNNL